MSSKQLNFKFGHLDIIVKAFSSDIQEESKARGMALKDHSLIYIDTKIPPEFQAEVLIHELLHMIWNFMNLGDKNKEEMTVDSMAKGLAMLIKDNPHFIKIITNALNGKKLPI